MRNTAESHMVSQDSRMHCKVQINEWPLILWHFNCISTKEWDETGPSYLAKDRLNAIVGVRSGILFLMLEIDFMFFADARDFMRWNRWFCHLNLTCSGFVLQMRFKISGS